MGKAVWKLVCAIDGHGDEIHWFGNSKEFLLFEQAPFSLVCPFDVCFQSCLCLQSCVKRDFPVTSDGPLFDAEITLTEAVVLPEAQLGELVSPNFTEPLFGAIRVHFRPKHRVGVVVPPQVLAARVVYIAPAILIGHHVQILLVGAQPSHDRSGGRAVRACHGARLLWPRVFVEKGS